MLMEAGLNSKHRLIPGLCLQDEKKMQFDIVEEKHFRKWQGLSFTFSVTSQQDQEACGFASPQVFFYWAIFHIK